MFPLKLLLANLALWVSLAPKALYFFFGVLFSKFTQKRILKSILRKRGLTLEGFQNFKATTYEDYEYDIKTILSSGYHPFYSEKIDRLCPTSGSSGGVKLIPYTNTLKKAFQNGIYPWLFCLYIRYPKLFFGKQYWSLTPTYAEGGTFPSGKVKVAFEEDEQYAGWLQSWLLNTVWLSTKQLLVESKTTEEFLLRLAKDLASHKNLKLISIWSPSLLSLLTEKGFSPNSGTVISCWGSNTSRALAYEIEKKHNVKIDPKGLLSTEFCGTTPITKNTHLLSITSHYFEFLTEAGEITSPDQTEVGKTYELIVTTQSGFIRYRTKDKVLVTNKFFSVPTLEFVGRDFVSDLFGEKLSEEFVENCLKRLYGENLFCFLAPIQTKQGTSYTLFVEKKRYCPGIEDFLEQLLCESYHYSYCRKLGQLNQAEVFPVQTKNLKKRFLQIRSQTTRLGDIKLQKLQTDLNWKELLS